MGQGGRGGEDYRQLKPARSCDRVRAAMDRPNFLLFITDQQRADHLGCYGNPTVRTPSIDSLAASGCLFENFYAATPSCMPNRASLMTGRMPSSHGLRVNGIELDHSQTTFVETLRAAGYRTALVGKSHLQNITTIPPPWPAPGEARLPVDARRRHPGRHGQEIWRRWEDDPDFELDLPYYGFDTVDLTILHGDDQHGHWRRWLRAQTPEADRLVGAKNAIPTPGLRLLACEQAWRTRLPEELYPTRYIGERTIGLMREFAREARPFFLECSFPDPHHPFTPPGRYWSRYSPEDVTLPTSFAAGESPPPHVAWLRAERDAGRAAKRGYAAFACDEHEAREAIALNYGSIAFIDDEVGRVLDELRRLGLDDRTVVMFTSDHGDLLGDHQLLLKGSLHYRSLARVAFLWRDCAPRRARRFGALAQTTDIAPTVLERAGLAPANGMQGRSLVPLMAGAAERVRDALVVEEESQRREFGWDRRVRMRSLVTEHHRLTVYEGRSWGELYDLRADPDELCNLWSQPAKEPLRAELMELFLRELLALSDSSPYPSASA